MEEFLEGVADGLERFGFLLVRVGVVALGDEVVRLVQEGVPCFALEACRVVECWWHGGADPVFVEDFVVCALLAGFAEEVEVVVGELVAGKILGDEVRVPESAQESVLESCGWGLVEGPHGHHSWWCAYI